MCVWLFLSPSPHLQHCEPTRRDEWIQAQLHKSQQNTSFCKLTIDSFHCSPFKSRDKHAFVHWHFSVLKNKPVIRLGGSRCVGCTARATWPKIRCRQNGSIPILKQDYIISSSFQPPVPTFISVGRLATCMKHSNEQSQASDLTKFKCSRSSWKRVFNTAPCWLNREVLLNTVQAKTLSIKQWARGSYLLPQGVPSLTLVHAWPAITVIHVTTQRADAARSQLYMSLKQ